MTTTIRLMDDSDLWYLNHKQTLYGDRAVAVMGSRAEEVFQWVEENRIYCGVARYNDPLRPCEFAVLKFPVASPSADEVKRINDGFMLLKLTIQGMDCFQTEGFENWQPCELIELPEDVE